MTYKDWDLLQDLFLLNTLNKQGQAAGASIAATAVARKLIDSLQNQLSGQAEVPNITAATNTDLNIVSLHSFDDLVQYLATNKISIDGSRIVYTGDEYKTLNQDDQDKYDPVTAKTVRDPKTRQWATANFYAHVPTLIKYVSYLQSKAKTMKDGADIDSKASGQTLEVLVGKIIDRLNEIEPSSGLNRKPKSQPDVPNEISEETPLDYFNAKTFDVNNPFSDSGQAYILFAKDLKSRNALNAWLIEGSPSKMSTIIMYDKDKKSKTYNYDSNEANRCVVMSTLYKRSKQKAQVAKTVEEQRAAQYYINKMKELAPTFTGPDDKPCDIGAAISNTSPNVQPTGQTGAAGNISSDLLMNIAQLQVFSRNDIDFFRIEKFLKSYNEIAGNNQTVSQNTVNARTAMHDATMNSSNMSLTNFPMRNNSIQAVKIMTKAPYRDFIGHLMNGLIGTIEYTGQVYRDFFNIYGERIKKENSGIYNNMIQQISGEWQANRTDLLDLQQAVSAALNRGEL